nr:tetratricopeptide repeat protein [Brevundimonas denitrificans]
MASSDAPRRSIWESRGRAGQGSIAATANVIFTLNALGRYDEALAEGDALLTIAAPGENGTDSERRSWRPFNLSRADALKGLGRYGEARALLIARLAELEGEGADAAQMADVHTRIAQVASLQRDWPAMADHRRRVMEHRRALGDPHAFGMAMALYGQVLSQIGEDQAAYEILTEALRILEGAEETTAQDRLYVLTYLGYAAVELGRLEEGERHLEAVIAAYRLDGEGQGSLANALRYLASLRTEQNRFDDAEALYLEALALTEGANDEEAASLRTAPWASSGALWGDTTKRKRPCAAWWTSRPNSMAPTASRTPCPCAIWLFIWVPRGVRSAPLTCCFRSWRSNRPCWRLTPPRFCAHGCLSAACWPTWDAMEMRR